MFFCWFVSYSSLSPIKTIKCLAGLSRQGVVNARESLKQCGLIDFVEGEWRKRSPQYQLLSLALADEVNEEQEDIEKAEQEREVDIQKEFDTVWTFCENNFEHLHTHFKYALNNGYLCLIRL